MAAYFIRQGGASQQGPFDEERIRGWIGQGRVRSEMEVSADGQLWIPVAEHRLFASAARPIAGPPPIRAIQPVDVVEEVPADDRASRPPRRPARRPTGRSSPAPAGGMTATAVVVGLLVVGGVAYVAMKGDGRTDQPRTASNAPGQVSPDPVVPVAVKPPGITKAEFKKKIGWNGFVLNMTKDEFIKKAGQPAHTQTIGGLAYWSYPCEDGTIQLILNSFFLNNDRILSEGLNDY